MTTGCVPSTRVASSSLDSVTASVCGSGVSSHASADRSSPSIGTVVSASFHDKSVDFLHRKVLSQQHGIDRK
jgi:hypothetical protein